MNVAQWRASQRAELTLPSGLTVRLKKKTLITLAAEGQIPDTLSNLVDDMQARKTTKVELSEFPQFAPLVDIVVRVCLVEPKLVLSEAEEDDEHITLESLDFEDRMEIFNWANRGAKKLAPFRPEQAPAVEPLQPGEPVRPTSVVVSFDSRPVDGLPTGLGGAAPGPADREPPERPTA